MEQSSPQIANNGPGVRVIGFEPTLATRVERVVERFNDEHPDTLALLAINGGLSGAEEAEISLVDSGGFSIAAQRRSRHAAHRAHRPYGLWIGRSLRSIDS